MKHHIKLASVLVVAGTLAALVSHGLAAWLNLQRNAGAVIVIGDTARQPVSYLAGSSLAGNAIAWPVMAAQLGVAMQAWSVPGGSPFEWEQFQDQIPDPNSSFLIVSPYDLNESLICDYRAQLVPITRTLEALANSEVDRQYVKRALSQYPQTWLRHLYPTLGRSRGILGDIRSRLKALIRPGDEVAAAEPVATLRFDQAEDAIDPSRGFSISSWSRSEMLRKLAVMREACQGRHWFNGPKHQAFRRMVSRAAARGPVHIVVLPVSSSYMDALLTPESRQEFENSLEKIQQEVPAARILRLDHIPGLEADANFLDLVHMNQRGQRLATAALQQMLALPSQSK